MTTLTPAQIAQDAYNAGFRGTALVNAVAIALAESGGNSAEYNPETAAGTASGQGSYGLWQIYLTAHPQYSASSLVDPQSNATAAYAVSSGGTNFSPWTAYNTGAYTGYLSQAQAAVTGLGQAISTAVTGATDTAYATDMSFFKAATNGNSGIVPLTVQSGGNPLMQCAIDVMNRDFGAASQDCLGLNWTDVQTIIASIEAGASISIPGGSNTINSILSPVQTIASAANSFQQVLASIASWITNPTRIIKLSMGIGIVLVVIIVIGLNNKQVQGTIKDAAGTAALA